MSLLFLFGVQTTLINEVLGQVALGDCLPSNCSEFAPFTANLIAPNQYTFTSSNTNGTSPTWTITAPSGIVTTTSGFSTTATFTENGTYTIVFRKLLNGVWRVCCRTLVNTIAAPCAIDFTLSRSCGRLQITFNQPVLPAGQFHQWDVGGGFATSTFTPPNAHVGSILNINTVAQSRTVGHRIVDAAGNVIGATCLREIGFTDFTQFAAHGIYIGGEYTASGGINFKTVMNLTNVISLVDLTIGGTQPNATAFFNGANYAGASGGIGTQTQIDWFINGKLRVDKTYIFLRCNLFMDQSSTIVIEPIPNTSGGGIPTLRFRNNVHVSSPCKLLWQGIEVRGGHFFSNDLTTMTGRNSIEDAVYGLRIFPGGHGFIPEIKLSQTNFTGNFIGMCAFSKFVVEPANPLIPNVGYLLSRFDDNIFEGVGNGTQSIAVPTTNAGYWPLVTTDQGQEFPFFQGQPAYTGILMNRVYLTVPNAIAAGTINVFQNISNGILMRAASTNIQRCPFERVLPFINTLANPPSFNFQTYGYGIQCIDGEGMKVRGYNITGLGGELWDPLTFNTVYKGVYCGAQKENMTVSITSCNMNEVQEGVTLISPSGNIFGNILSAIVEHNSIRANANYNSMLPIFNPPLPLFWGTPQVHGIYLNDQFFDPTPVAGVVGFSTYQINHNFVEVDENTTNINGAKMPVLGIQVEGTGTTFMQEMDCQIKYNSVTLLAAEQGIIVNTTNSALLRDNTIHMNNAASNQNISTVQGIRIAGGANHQILCNHIFSVQTQPITHFGINVENSPDVVYENNDIHGTDEGLAFFGSCNNSEVRNNRFISEVGQGRQMGFSLFYNEDVNMVIPTLVGIQPNFGNRWIQNAPFSQGNGSVWASADLLLMSPLDNRYTVNENSPNLAPPNCSVNNPPTWFDCSSQKVPLATLCPAIPPGLIGDSTSFTALDKSIAASNEWTSSRSLYFKVRKNPVATAGDADMNYFLSERMDKPLGQLADIELAIPSAFGFDPTIRATVAANDALILVKTNQLGVVSTAFATDSTNVNLILQSENLFNEINALALANQALIDQGNAQRLTATSDLLEQLNGVQPENIFEENWKWVLSQYLQTVGSAAPITEANLMELKTLAETCFSDGGPAVFNARSLFSGLTNIILPLPDCEGVGFRSKTKGNPMPETFSIQPNPVMDQMLVKWSTSFHPVQISIIDGLGRTVKTIAIDSNDTFEQVVLIADLPTGVYFIAMRNEARAIETQRFLLQH